MSPKSPAVTRTRPRMPERKVTQASLGQAGEVSLPLLPTKMPSQTRHPLPLPAPAVPYGTEPGDGTPPRQARGCVKQPGQGATATAHSTTGDQQPGLPPCTAALQPSRQTTSVGHQMLDVPSVPLRISSRRGRALKLAQESGRSLCSRHGQYVTPPCQLRSSTREKARTAEKPPSTLQQDRAVISISSQRRSLNLSKTLLLLAKTTRRCAISIGKTLPVLSQGLRGLSTQPKSTLSMLNAGVMVVSFLTL